MTTQMKSRRYTLLEKRLKQLKKNFHFKQSIYGITPLQADKLRGFRLLCHAEIEDYFESTALDLLEKAEKKWDNNKCANYNLAALFIWHEKISSLDTSTTKAKKIIFDFKKEIKDNHGIKENNIKNMFEPLGYKISNFDATFISILSSFGSLRGETAHTSAHRTQQPLDQNTEIVQH